MLEILGQPEEPDLPEELGLLDPLEASGSVGASEVGTELLDPPVVLEPLDRPETRTDQLDTQDQ